MNIENRQAIPPKRSILSILSRNLAIVCIFYILTVGFLALSFGLTLPIRYAIHKSETARCIEFNPCMIMTGGDRRNGFQSVKTEAMTWDKAEILDVFRFIFYSYPIKTAPFVFTFENERQAISLHGSRLQNTIQLTCNQMNLRG